MNHKRSDTDHSITVLTLFGKFRFSTRENLFEKIMGMEKAYVVDNHIDWADLSARPENSNKAFLLGTTIDKEHSPRLSFFENSQGRKIRYNAFLFGMRSPSPRDVPLVGKAPLLWIMRLDEHALPNRDREAMLEWERSGKRWDDSADVSLDKQRMLGLLGVKDVDELGRKTFEVRKAKDAELQAKVHSEQPKCFKDFIKSIEVARYAYAALLLNKSRARSLFVDTSNRHVLGDMQLIQNALFWRAEILSNDKHARWMAHFCGIKFPTKKL